MRLSCHVVEHEREPLSRRQWVKHDHQRKSMHDLHVWSISAENVACSCHIVVVDQSLPDSERVMRAVEERLGADFGIGHTTSQVEDINPCHEEAEHLMHHNHPHVRLVELALEGRRRTPLSRRRSPRATSAMS
jgi:hypothetical protein